MSQKHLREYSGCNIEWHSRRSETMDCTLHEHPCPSQATGWRRGDTDGWGLPAKQWGEETRTSILQSMENGGESAWCSACTVYPCTTSDHYEPARRLISIYACFKQCSWCTAFYYNKYVSDGSHTEKASPLMLVFPVLGRLQELCTLVPH